MEKVYADRLSPSGGFAVLALCLGVVIACSNPDSEPPAWPRGEPPPPYPAQEPRKSETDTTGSDADPSITAPAKTQPRSAQPSRPLYVLSGEASYYSDSLAGNKTASGEIYNPDKLTAAHKTLAFGSVVRVVRQDTGRAVVVTVNDRGPFGDKERIIDLSRAAATKLEMLRAGVVKVRVEVLSEPGNK